MVSAHDAKGNSRSQDVFSGAGQGRYQHAAGDLFWACFEQVVQVLEELFFGFSPGIECQQELRWKYPGKVGARDERE